MACIKSSSRGIMLLYGVAASESLAEGVRLMECVTFNISQTTSYK